MRAITLVALRRAAAHYVTNHASTEQRLREVLSKRVRSCERKTGQAAPADTAAWIDTVVAELVRMGAINDQRFAEARAESLRARGKSARAVANALRIKGVQDELAQQAVAGTDVSDDEAARVLVRKRKLGPYRDASVRTAYRQKDLAVLARAGFSFATAKKALDTEPE